MVRAGGGDTGLRPPHSRLLCSSRPAGFARGYLVSAAVLVLAVIIALAMIRVSRQDLSGADPVPEPAIDVISQSRA